MMRAAALLLGLATSAALAAEAGACSRLPVRPADWAPIPSEESRLASFREPSLASLIRDAAFIEIASAAEFIATGHTRWPPDFGLVEIETYTIRFTVIERLKGASPNSILVSRAGDFPIIETHYPSWHEHLAASSASDIASFERAPLVPESRDSCGGLVGVSFMRGWPYLLVRNETGDVEAAIPLETASVAAATVPAGTFDDHLWVRMVRRALANPLDDRVHEASVAEYMRARGPLTVYEVTDCERPRLEPRAQLGEIGHHARAGVIEGYPTSLEEYLTSDMAAPFSNANPPLGYADYAAIDAHRFAYTPVDPRFCQLGQRFLLAGLQYFPIDEYDRVHLTSIATQVRIIDEGAYPLSQIAEWLQPEPPQ